MKIEHVLAVIDRPAAWAWIRAHYLPAGVICPSCGATVVGSRAINSFIAMARTYCKSCGGTFQAKAAIPVLRGTEWHPEEYVKLILLHLAGQQPAQIAGILGKSTSCVRGMLDRIEIMGALDDKDPIHCPAHQLKG